MRAACHRRREVTVVVGSPWERTNTHSLAASASIVPDVEALVFDVFGTGELPWTKLDALHRLVLDELVEEFSLTGMSEAELQHFNHVWQCSWGRRN